MASSPQVVVTVSAVRSASRVLGEIAGARYAALADDIPSRVGLHDRWGRGFAAGWHSTKRGS